MHIVRVHIYTQDYEKRRDRTKYCLQLDATLYNCSINNSIYSIYELWYFNLPNLTKLSENSKIPLNPRFCVFAVR